MKKYKLEVTQEVKLKLERMKEILAGTPRGEYISGVDDGCGGVCMFTCSYYCRPTCIAQCSTGCGSDCTGDCFNTGVFVDIVTEICPTYRILYI